MRHNKLLIFLTTMIIVVFSVMLVVATVEIDYDRVSLGNTDDTEYITCWSDGDTLNAQSTGGLETEWGDWDGDYCKLFITANEYTDLGTQTVNISEEGNHADDAFQTVQVFVYDNHKVKLSSVKAGSRKATVKWNKSYSEAYNLQYKIAGGKWKNAFKAKECTSFTVKNLKKGKKYSFRVRTAAYSDFWKYEYGPWSKTITKKIK